MPLNWIITKLAGDYNAKQLAKLQPTVHTINEHYVAMDALTDEQVQAKTAEFQERISNGESLDDLLPEAFATVKQAAKRMVGMEIEVK
jgi:preprotein translocase subunit SecA